MEFDREHLRDVVDAITSRGTKPPRMVFQAVGALVGPRKIRRAAVESSRTEEGGTVWRVLALVDNALVSVQATSEHAGWGFDGSLDSEQYDGTLEDARLVPLSEVVGCTVSAVEPDQAWGDGGGIYECRPSWTLVLRDGTSVPIPATRDESADEIAAELLEILAGEAPLVT